MPCNNSKHTFIEALRHLFLNVATFQSEAFRSAHADDEDDWKSFLKHQEQSGCKDLGVNRVLCVFHGFLQHWNVYWTIFFGVGTQLKRMKVCFSLAHNCSHTSHLYYKGIIFQDWKNAGSPQDNIHSLSLSYCMN